MVVGLVAIQKRVIIIKIIKVNVIIILEKFGFNLYIFFKFMKFKINPVKNGG